MTGDTLKTKTKLLVAVLSFLVVLIFLFSISPAVVKSIQPDSAWRGRYYNNAELRGIPARVSEDAVITFDWGEERPFPELSPDQFSVRWTHSEEFPAGVYIFAVRCDGGAKVYFDDELILDMWSPGYHDWTATEHEVTAGKHHLRVEYFDNEGVAYIQFGYYPAEN